MQKLKTNVGKIRYVKQIFVSSVKSTNHNQSKRFWNK